VARAMAEGAARRFGVAGTISVTGVAGPGGGSPEKPVGTVWLACALAGVVEARRSLLAGTRHEIRARAAQAALLFLYRRLSS
jgi:PncC family amidohydrolase